MMIEPDVPDTTAPRQHHNATTAAIVVDFFISDLLQTQGTPNPFEMCQHEHLSLFASVTSEAERRLPLWRISGKLSNIVSDGGQKRVSRECSTSVQGLLTAGLNVSVHMKIPEQEANINFKN